MRRLALLLAVLAGCGELTSTPVASDAGDSGEVVVADAAPSDAAPGETTVGDGGVPLVTNGGFDRSCDQWDPYHATAEWVADAGRSGGACMVCVTGSPPDGFGIAQSIAIIPTPGQTLTGESWVRFASGLGGKVNLVLRTRDDAGTVVESAGNPYVPLQDTYAVSGKDLAVTRSAAYVTLSAFEPDEGGVPGCFFIDDVTLTVR